LDDNRSAATGDFNFGSTVNVEVLEVRLELSVGSFKVDERLL
jgi:hypothetical protein